MSKVTCKILVYKCFIFLSESKKLQRRARDELQRILDEQERLNNELEAKKRKLDLWSRDLNKREVVTEQEKQKLEEDKKMVIIYGIFRLLVLIHSFSP